MLKQDLKFAAPQPTGSNIDKVSPSPKAEIKGGSDGNALKFETFTRGLDYCVTLAHADL